MATGDKGDAIRLDPAKVALERREQAALWCQELAEGELSQADQDAFDTWLAEPRNADAFVEANDLLRLMGGLGDERDLISLRTAALNDFQEQSSGTQAGHWRKALMAFAFAASVAFAYFGFVAPGASAIRHFATPVGEMRLVTLDDGSQLTLDGNSAVDVEIGSQRRALALLRGRARFNVAKDASRPFTVVAGNRMVVATGTAFSVEMLGKEVHVQLFEGKVSVLDRKAGDTPRSNTANLAPERLESAPHLVPGEEFVASLAAPVAPRITPFRLSPGDTWEDGEIVFEDTPLAQAVERMNRYSRHPLVLSDQAVGKLKVNGVFRAGDAHAFLDGLSTLYPVKVSNTQDGWQITTD